MLDFLSVFPPYRGGIARFSERLSQELKLSIEVQNHNFKRQYPRILFPGTTQLQEGSQPESAALYHPYNPLVWNRIAKSFFLAESKVLLFSYWHPFFIPSLLPILKEAGKRGIKTIGLFHNVVPHERFPFKEKLIKSLLNHTDEGIFLSSQTYNEAVQLCPAFKATILFHPVYEHAMIGDASLVRTLVKADENTSIFLFFGLVRPYKGVEVLIKAFCKSKLPNSKLIIAGEFYEPEENYRKLLSNTCDGEVYMMNKFASYEEMADLFKAADVLVVPYRTASQSGVIADGIWFETPMIVSNLPGLTEHIDNEVHGLHFEAGNEDALAQCLVQLQDREKREKMREAIKVQRERLSWSNFAKKVLEVVQSV